MYFVGFFKHFVECIVCFCIFEFAKSLYMKKLYFLFIFFILCSLQSQVINFPDANLKAKLLEADVNNDIADHTKLDTNQNGEIEVAEAQAFWGFLNISNSSISDLTGLSYFSFSGFDCSNNLLTSLNGLNQQSLEFLKCDHNQLTELSITTSTIVDIICSHNQLESLDLSMLPVTYTTEIQNNNISEFQPPIYVGYLNIRNNNFNGFTVPSFTSLASVFLFGNNPSDALFYSNPWRMPMELRYTSDSATLVDLSNVPMAEYELNNTQPSFSFANCNSLETIKLNNSLISGSATYGGIDIQNCNNLHLICADVDEVNYFNQRLGELGLNGQVVISSECQLSNSSFETQEIVLFPNPVETIVNIKLPNSIIINEISVYNTIGQLLLKSTNSSSIDVSSLTIGNYLLKIHSDNQVFVEKFIKQ